MTAPSEQQVRELAERLQSVPTWRGAAYEAPDWFALARAALVFAAEQQGVASRGNACINCGARGEGGYEIEEVGSFCAECWRLLREHFRAEQFAEQQPAPPAPALSDQELAREPRQGEEQPPPVACEDGPDCLDRLRAEVDFANAHGPRADHEPVTDSSLMYGDLRKILAVLEWRASLPAVPEAGATGLRQRAEEAEERLRRMGLWRREWEREAKRRLEVIGRQRRRAVKAERELAELRKRHREVVAEREGAVAEYRRMRRRAVAGDEAARALAHELKEEARVANNEAATEDSTYKAGRASGLWIAVRRARAAAARLGYRLQEPGPEVCTGPHADWCPVHPRVTEPAPPPEPQHGADEELPRARLAKRWREIHEENRRLENQVLRAEDALAAAESQARQEREWWGGRWAAEQRRADTAEEQYHRAAERMTKAERDGERWHRGFHEKNKELVKQGFRAEAAERELAELRRRAEFVYEALGQWQAPKYRGLTHVDLRAVLRGERPVPGKEGA